MCPSVECIVFDLGFKVRTREKSGGGVLRRNRLCLVIVVSEYWFLSSEREDRGAGIELF
jgi:hypothetical protein